MGQNAELTDFYKKKILDLAFNFTKRVLKIILITIQLYLTSHQQTQPNYLENVSLDPLSHTLYV